MKFRTEAAGPATKVSLRHDAGQLILMNRLPPKHPRRLDLENAIRGALAELAGRWDVTLEGPVGHALVVSVVAPDGSTWSMSCCNPDRRDPASIAETVRAACSRRRWLDPDGTRGGDGRAGDSGASARERS